MTVDEANNRGWNFAVAAFLGALGVGMLTAIPTEDGVPTQARRDRDPDHRGRICGLVLHGPQQVLEVTDSICYRRGRSGHQSVRALCARIQRQRRPRRRHRHHNRSGRLPCHRGMELLPAAGGVSKLRVARPPFFSALLASCVVPLHDKTLAGAEGFEPSALSFGVFRQHPTSVDERRFRTQTVD